MVLDMMCLYIKTAVEPRSNAFLTLQRSVSDIKALIFEVKIDKYSVQGN